MAENEMKCKQCGADLKFEPGTTSLKCPYCSAENPIEQPTEEGEAKPQAEELDFNAYLDNLEEGGDTQEVQVVRCDGCGSELQLKADVTSDECPFCGTSIVTTNTTSSRQIKPQNMLPFKVTNKEASASFKKWLAGLWFAPNKLKKYARTDQGITGIYVPYWTYDSDTYSHYTGQRGEDYYVTETYTTTENGKSVTKTRRVKKIRWYSVSGNVSVSFDDILVLASTSLPKKYADELEPWDLENLTGYDDKYLSGFRSESYHVGLKEGFAEAREIMADTIKKAVRRDIGGDHQRIHTVDTSYSNITFKHILLPIWINSYKYQDKVYRFLVNGRTGEVQGERPWSWAKIALAVGGALAVIGTIIYLVVR